MEWQAERTHKYPFGFLLKTEFWYEKLSDYGRSIAKPFVLFVFTILVYAGIYCYIAGDAQKWLKSLVYSASQMFAFLPNSRIAIEKMGQSLFGQTMPEWIYIITGSQNLLAFILLFLIGLGLRFRYRV